MSAMSSTALFSLDDLSPFERHGATITPREADDYSAGCRVTLPNGWSVSIQWGVGNYSDNYRNKPGEPPRDSTTAEIAVFTDTDNMVTWLDGDNVQGYCPMGRVLRVIDLVAEGKLLREYTPPTQLRADDSHV